MTKVLVFGIFDGLHPGHLSFLRQAKKHGDFLVVAVGRDSAVKKFKSKAPKFAFKERLKMVKNVKCVDKAIPGDSEQGSYKVIENEKPHVICLGYDQQKLQDDLNRWLRGKNFSVSVLVKTLKPYKHRKYHTSILTQT